MPVVTALLPLLPGARAEAQLFRLRVRAGVEIDIPIHFIVVPRQVASQQAAGVEINDVGYEAEAEVRLRAGALNLVVARESEDIVADDVGRAVVLMKSAVRMTVPGCFPSV